MENVSVSAFFFRWRDNSEACTSQRRLLTLPYIVESTVALVNISVLAIQRDIHQVSKNYDAKNCARMQNH